MSKPSRSSKPTVGDVAPDFTAKGTGGRSYSLSEFAGRPVILVFYPGDATPTCTEQLTSYSTDFSEFENLGTAVLALSPQDVASHERFSEAHGGFSFPLLHDEDKRIGQAYGILGPVGFYRRSVFVIDAQGFIRYARRSIAGLGYTKTGDLVAVVRTLGDTSSRP